MVKSQGWTGFDTVALQEAMRQSVRGFAEILGVETTTVANWRSGLSTVRPRPLTQEMLDTLQRADSDVVARFEQIVAEGESAWKAARSLSRPQRSTAVSTQAQFTGSTDNAATLLSALDNTRMVVDHTLTSSTVSSLRLDLLEERAAKRVMTYTTTPPASPPTTPRT
jgi:hypothetical protein